MTSDGLAGRRAARASGAVRRGWVAAGLVLLVALLAACGGSSVAKSGAIKSSSDHAIRMRAFFVPSGNVEQYFVFSGGAATLDAPHPAYDRLLETFKLTP